MTTEFEFDNFPEEFEPHPDEDEAGLDREYDEDEYPQDEIDAEEQYEEDKYYGDMEEDDGF